MAPLVVARLVLVGVRWGSGSRWGWRLSLLVLLVLVPSMQSSSCVVGDGADDASRDLTGPPGGRESELEAGQRPIGAARTCISWD